MAEYTQTRTARAVHDCYGCAHHGHITGTIRPGHRYLRHVKFPDGDGNPSGAPWVLAECIDCACGRDDFAGHAAAACSTFCHGVTPCARPFEHKGDHSCKRCPEFAARAS